MYNGLGKIYPVYVREQLEKGQLYEVEIVDAANRWFGMGVATAEIRNKADSHKEK